MKTILLAAALLAAPYVIHADTLPPPPTIDLRVQPSPARGECTIAWAPSGFAPVSISIRDVRGHVLRRLEGGTNMSSVRWDGRDSEGRNARPGVYYVRLTTVDLEKHTRLILFR